jgi:hypothetical protein
LILNRQLCTALRQRFHRQNRTPQNFIHRP